MKICSKKDCLFFGQSQSLENFCKRDKVKDGLKSCCKSCDKISRRKHYEKNSERLIAQQKDFYQQNKEEIKAQARVRHHKNKERHNKLAKKWKQEHREEVRIYNKQYKDSHKKEAAEYAKKRHNEDINAKLATNLRNRLRDAIKEDYKSGSAISSLGILNGGIPDLKLWLEEQFYNHPITDEIMSWNNHGKLWHIDHIIPLSSVDLSDLKQLRKVCNFFNLRPRWAYQNISDGDRGMSRNRKNVT